MKVILVALALVAAQVSLAVLDLLDHEDSLVAKAMMAQLDLQVA